MSLHIVSPGFAPSRAPIEITSFPRARPIGLKAIAFRQFSIAYASDRHTEPLLGAQAREPAKLVRSDQGRSPFHRRGQKTGASCYDYDPETRAAKPSPVTETVIQDFVAKSGVNPRTITDEEVLERCL